MAICARAQRCDALDRVWRKEAKIEARIGDDWRRTKGMMRHTYDRLIEELLNCQDRREVAFCATAARMFGAEAIERIAPGYD